MNVSIVTFVMLFVIMRDKNKKKYSEEDLMYPGYWIEDRATYCEDRRAQQSDRNEDEYEYGADYVACGATEEK